MSTAGDTVSVGDIMSTARGVQCAGGYYEYSGEDTMMSVGGYHEYTGRCSVYCCFHANSIVFPMTFPHIYYDIFQCTEHPPVYS